jgi:hypothetical protein
VPSASPPTARCAACRSGRAPPFRRRQPCLTDAGCSSPIGEVRMRGRSFAVYDGPVAARAGAPAVSTSTRPGRGCPTTGPRRSTRGITTGACVGRTAYFNRPTTRPARRSRRPALSSA